MDRRISFMRFVDAHAPSSKEAQASPRFLLILSALLLPGLLLGAAPQWWSDRAVLDSQATVNDYAVINQGQLKHLATKAYAELQSKLPSSVWTNVPGTNLTALVNSFQTNSAYNYTAVNLGQLKNVAKPFYDVLNSVGYTNSVVGSPYPWSNSSSPANDYAMANVGQAKNLFSFDLTGYTPPNQLPDAWQLQYFGQTGIDPNADPDRDGLKNIEEYQLNTNPTKYSTYDDGMSDGYKRDNGLDLSKNDANGDADHDGVLNYMDARPNDFDVGSFAVTITTPSNGTAY